MPSSPRVPTSPDISRRRVPRPKDRRRALRDFYGLQSGNSTASGPVKHDALLDGPEFSIEEYLNQLNDAKDVKRLLKLENLMVREIRVLDGERKALVYDNYGKMIRATQTIKNASQNPLPVRRG